MESALVFNHCRRYHPEGQGSVIRLFHRRAISSRRAESAVGIPFASIIAKAG